MATIQKTPVWEPRNVQQTNVHQFIRYVNEKHQLHLRTYEDLHQWSVASTSLQDFWRDAYDWLQLAPPGAKGTGRVLEGSVSLTRSTAHIAIDVVRKVTKTC